MWGLSGGGGGGEGDGWSWGLGGGDRGLRTSRVLGVGSLEVVGGLSGGGERRGGGGEGLVGALEVGSGRWVRIW